MHIEVRLFASFREGRFRQARLELESGRTVAGLIAELGIKLPEVGISLVNGRHADPEQQLQNGDVVALFPPIAGG